MAYFQTQNHNLGKFWRLLQWEDACIFYGHLVYFTVNLVDFMVIWYIFSRVGVFY
jgi:hypothetical protein